METQFWILISMLKPSPIPQSVAYRPSEQEVASLIPRLGQYSFRGLMIVLATGFIPLSLLSVVSTTVM